LEDDLVGINQRQQLRKELVEQGFTWEFIDEPNPKIKMYRHAPGMNVDGVVVFPAGSVWPGKTTTDPRYILSKARIGVFPFPPSEHHECKWCAASYPKTPVEEIKEELIQETMSCQECAHEVSALTKAGAVSKMRVHNKTHQEG